jgi:tRNA-specific 2-thiouridylase
MEEADRLGCKYIATGHYVRTVRDGENVFIKQGADNKKDQSYFLWRLSQEQLRRTLFPLGEMTKEEARTLLKEVGLTEKAKDGESMEICFFDGDYRDYLRSAIPDADSRIKPGYFVDSEGRKIGEHKGFPYYTIGQRKGLEIALGKPAYVIKLNPQKNTVMLGNADELKAEYMLTESPLWVNEEEALQSEELTVRIRYRSQPIPCRVYPLEDGRMLVQFLEEASSVTPGQSAVFYIGNRVVGGAFIANQKGVNYVAQTVLSE